MRIDKLLAEQIIEIIDNSMHKFLGAIQDGRVVLGGSAGSAGGIGNPPAGFWGQLRQANVTYDTAGSSRACTTGSAGSDSLVDNLDAIRLGWEICNDAMGERHIDWGLGDGQISAVDIPFQTTSGSIDATNVRDAIEETYAECYGSGGSAADGNTLDEAYDQGGAGAGRTITVDSGAVQLDGAGGLGSQGNIVLDDDAGDSPELRFVGGSNDDAAILFLDDDAVAGDSDLVVRLPGALLDGDLCALRIQDSGGNEIAYVDLSEIYSTVPLIVSDYGRFTSATEPALEARLVSALTNTVGTVFRLIHSGGTTAAGFGSRLLYRLEDDGGALEDAAAIDAIWDDAGASSEDSRIDFLLRTAGAALAWCGRLLNSGYMVAAGLWLAGDCQADRVRNNSGAAAAANDVGYIDENGQYKTTTTQYDDVAWCVVVYATPGNDGDGDADDDIWVANRGRVTVTLDANCSVGDYLYTSGTAKQATPQSYVRKEVFAVARTANAGGAGGTCEAVLLCETRFIPASNDDFVCAVAGAATSDFVAKIDDNAGLHGGTGLTATTVPWDNLTSGSENSIAPRNTSVADLGKMRLYNSTRATYRLITSVDKANDVINTVNTADAWADNDDITIRSQTCAAVGAMHWIDVELTQTTAIPELARALLVSAMSNDTGAAYHPVRGHPWEAYSLAKRHDIANAVASIRNDKEFTLPLIQERFCWGFTASGAATAWPTFTLVGYWLAVP